jgi:hypothetical protein
VPHNSPQQTDTTDRGFVPGVGVSSGLSGAAGRWLPAIGGQRSPVLSRSVSQQHLLQPQRQSSGGDSPDNRSRHSSSVFNYSLPDDTGTGRTRASSRASSRHSRPSSASSAVSAHARPLYDRGGEDEEENDGDSHHGSSRHRRRRHSDGGGSVGSRSERGGMAYTARTGRSDAQSEFSLFARTMAYDPAAGVAARRAADYLASQSHHQLPHQWGDGSGAPVGADVAFGGTRAWAPAAATASYGGGGSGSSSPARQQLHQPRSFRTAVAASDLLQAGNAASSSSSNVLRGVPSGLGLGGEPTSASPPQQWRSNPALHPSRTGGDALGGALPRVRSVLGNSAAVSLLSGGPAGSTGSPQAAGGGVRGGVGYAGRRY